MKNDKYFQKITNSQTSTIFPKKVKKIIEIPKIFSISKKLQYFPKIYIFPRNSIFQKNITLYARKFSPFPKNYNSSQKY
jgi:hypothetical protein